MKGNFTLFVVTSTIAAFLACGCSSKNEAVGIQGQSKTYYRTDSSGNRVSYISSGRPGSRSVNSLIAEVHLRQDILSRGSRGRTGRSMRPRYITIHSTQNWRSGADANRHALALRNGAMGRISWHYTVDDNRAVQHLPTTEQGNHADHDGPGNHYSVGIEMCEHPGCGREATLDRTAKLTAYLMVRHNIPLSRVVPHYHWPRWGKYPPNKNCPHFLMTNGRPGEKWQAFLARVGRYYNEVAGRPGSFAGR